MSSISDHADHSRPTGRRPRLTDMSTKVRKVTTEDLTERRAAILQELGITDAELRA
jgi:hypothetical protein